MSLRPDKSLMSGVEILGPTNIRDANAPVSWSIDPASGVVQGPLDLCFVAGRTLLLTLEGEQVAVFSVAGELKGVYLEGVHSLAVARDDATGSPGQALVHFLHLMTPLEIPWRQHIPVAPLQADDPTSRLAHGSFTVQIIDPIRFYRAFLRDCRGETDRVCVEALAHLLPTFLSILLSRICGPRATFEKQSLALHGLDAGDLDAVLDPYGIQCTGISVREGFGDILELESTAYLPSVTATC